MANPEECSSAKDDAMRGEMPDARRDVMRGEMPDVRRDVMRGEMPDARRANAADGPGDAMVLDMRGPLPRGSLSIEASAGTGKTYTITMLALRSIVEGACTIDKLLLITFTRASTHEMKRRLITTLEHAYRVMRQPRDGVQDEADQDLRDLIVSGDSETDAWRLQNLDTALRDIDKVSVLTIDAFCREMLTWVGQPVPEMRYAFNLNPWLQANAAFVTATQQPRFDEFLIKRLIDQATATPAPQAALEAHQPGAWFVSLYTALRAQIERLHAVLRMPSFGDIEQRLLHVVTHDANVRKAIQARYTTVFIDEMQDTSASQIALITTLFDIPESTERAFIAVGDPKQSIYQFRGADISSYITLRDRGHLKKLTSNYRSDERYVEAINALYQAEDIQEVIHANTTLSFGEHITYDTIDAKQPTRIQRDTGQPIPPIVWRHGNTEAQLNIQDYALRLRYDVYREIRDLLHHARIEGKPVTLSDIAILLPNRGDITAMQSFLEAQGIPTLSRIGNLGDTTAWSVWHAVLEGIAVQASDRAVRMLAIQPIIQRGSQMSEESALDGLYTLAAQAREILDNHGMVALFTHLVTSGDAGYHVALHQSRLMTDMMHIATTIDERLASDGVPPGTGSALAMLAQLDVQRDGNEEQHLNRRKDTSTEAIELTTIHSAKGLEWPIVLLPMSNLDTVRVSSPLLAPTDTGAMRLFEKSGLQDGTWDVKQAYAEQQAREESVRKLYVQLTRARHHSVVWMAPSMRMGGRNYRNVDPMQELYATITSPTAPIPPALIEVQSWDVTQPIHTLTCDPWTPQPVDMAEPTIGTRQRKLAWHDGLHSYSSLARTVDAMVSRETSSPPGPLPVTPSRYEPALPLDTEVPLASLPSGAESGTSVHTILENVDFTGPHLEERVREAVEHEGILVNQLDEPVLDEVIEGICQVIRSPLGAEMGGVRLCDIPRSQRLDEMHFMLGLDGASKHISVRTIAQVVLEHLDETDQFREYWEQLASQPPRPISGYLHGFMDLMIGVPMGETMRYMVCDYKTNRIVPSGARMSVGSFMAEELVAEMEAHHYPLQALVYIVGLHRYVGARLDGYDPEVHLGGAAYLFVRGLIGPETPEGCGVLVWRPPTACVEAVNAWLAGGHDAV